jgi:hypothetical protein
MNNYGLGDLYVTKQNKTKQTIYIALNIDKCGPKNDIIYHPTPKLNVLWNGQALAHYSNP